MRIDLLLLGWIWETLPLLLLLSLFITGEAERAVLWYWGVALGLGFGVFPLTLTFAVLFD
jgi:hypothetical protein